MISPVLFGFVVDDVVVRIYPGPVGVMHDVARDLGSGLVEVAESLAAALLDASPDGMLLVDQHGEITVANPAAARIFGRSQEELVGASVESLVPAEQRGRHVAHRNRYLDSPVIRPMGSGLRLLAEHADGTLFPVEISLSPIELDEVRIIATVRDVTDRQEAMARESLHQERERIARDLHDLVIQRLFAAGMSLASISQQVAPGRAADELVAITQQLDGTISEIRRSIFRLGQPDDGVSTTNRLVGVVGEHTSQLGFDPEIEIDGDLDAIPTGVGEQLVATLTEALSNVVRHAHATRVRIGVSATERTVGLTVTDDGVGLSGEVIPLRGLSNMRWRADRMGGRCTIESDGPTGGTTLTWSVPLPDPIG